MKKIVKKIVFAAVLAECFFAVSPVFAKKSKKAAQPAEAVKADKSSKKETAGQQEKTSKNAGKEKVEKYRKIVESVEDEGVFQSKTVDATVGNIRYLMKGTVGSFQMYAIGKNDSQTPLFASYDEFTSSFFSLLAGDREYRLTNNIGIALGARRNNLGGQLVYIVPNVARVFVKFERMEHSDNVKSEIVKVTAVVLNRSRHEQEFALKSVLDTVLGEKVGPHFTSADELAINTERQYRKMDKFKWISSGNERAEVQFMFTGADITRPEVVSLSNKDILALQNWVPSIANAKTFDSVLSYNNSAICINWPKNSVKPGESCSYVYYMAVSTDGQKCDGEKYISELERSLRNGGIDERYSVKEFEDAYKNASELYASAKYPEAYEVVAELWKNPEHRNERLVSLKRMIEEKLGIVVDDNDIWNVPKQDVPVQKNDAPSNSGNILTDGFKYDPSAITKEQLDAAYIQGLIERINSLDDNSDNVDRSEILKLNAELDAILKKLEQN